MRWILTCQIVRHGLDSAATTVVDHLGRSMAEEVGLGGGHDADSMISTGSSVTTPSTMRNERNSTVSASRVETRT
ncbi:hypothetical protein SAMN05443668_104562 [Cryptosporangium aurantiacum]|uniref:Uncharacterized protein n=1 Tax=Cryptosporangium aurantiacum TaxID=134849 RepID=A0A1M7QET4_9ACTN|nr:hypothetical protein SAMN05443668_104562 [Cryptosporangium aurantiacum]